MFLLPFILANFKVVFPCAFQRRSGDPLRVYMDLESGRKKSGLEDIFISYHAEDDVQSTYAGALFHNGRNYHVSSYKNNVSFLTYSCLLVLIASTDVSAKNMLFQMNRNLYL